MSTTSSKMIARWTLDENNYRIAVQTKNGILQVKSVTNGETEMDPRYFTFETADGVPYTGKLVEKPAPEWWKPRSAKKTEFADFMLWYASLPQGGKVTITPITPSGQKKMRPLDGTTDTDKMNLLASRFEIHNPKYHYKQSAYLIIGDMVRKIYCERDLSIPGPITACPNYIRVEGDDKRYNTFAEIGDCLDKNGKPKITVNYRKKVFSVADLF